MKKVQLNTYKTATCHWCTAPRVWRASRSCGFNTFACEDHTEKLRSYERSRDSGYMSEADHQTWGRL